MEEGLNETNAKILWMNENKQRLRIEFMKGFESFVEERYEREMKGE